MSEEKRETLAEKILRISKKEGVSLKSARWAAIHQMREEDRNRGTQVQVREVPEQEKP